MVSPRNRSVWPGIVAMAAALLGPACLSWSELERGACGDGFLGREEACDDGNRFAGDGCGDDCRIEPASCGDGRRDEGEDCDDANGVETDACVDGCRAAVCGDGRLWELEEECDDGNLSPGDGCSESCTREALPSGPFCGDGVVDADEACDDGNQSKADSCLIGCSFAACGDGVVWRAVEECDDAGASKACSRGCMRCGDVPGSYFRASNGHCYTLHDGVESQPEARTACQAEGGDLWTVTSEAEGNDVGNKLALTERYWLGLHTGGSMGSGWVTGEATKYTHFGADEPRDVALRCVAFEQGGWVSEACRSQLAFVCERSPAFVFPADHHAYRLRTGSLSSSAARAACAADGGQLAMLESEAERQFVGKNVGVVAWLDASDTAAESQFVWASGVEVEQAAFAVGRPNDPAGTRACLVLNPSDKFVDLECDATHAYLCEYD